MCGIVGFTGTRDALPVLLQGLQKLEYRGYDSAGVALCAEGSLDVVKAVGKVDVLAEKIRARSGRTSNRVCQGAEFGDEEGRMTDDKSSSSFPHPSSLIPNIRALSGIAHTRWATHGGVTETNAHPHVSNDGAVAIVHNGIVENDRIIRDMLVREGWPCVSETDSEVFAQLIARFLRALPAAGRRSRPSVPAGRPGSSPSHAVLSALREVRGTYGLVAVFRDHPGLLIVARMGSPIVIGKGTDGTYVASDPNATLAYTRDVIYLDDGEVAVCGPDGRIEVGRPGSGRIEKGVTRIEWSEEEIQKGGYPHFMLKEIMEQPDVIRNALRGRISLDEGLARLGGLVGVEERLRDIDRLIIVGCGTAYNAGLVGEYMLEELAGLPVEVECASEFRYRNPVLTPGTAVLAVSQSGETADTLAAVREAKRRGLLTLGIVNAVGSTIARETDAGVYNHAGPEIGVASTKAFTSQLAVLALLTLSFGRLRSMPYSEGRRFAEALIAIPLQIERIMARRGEIARIARRFEHARGAFFLGRKYLAPLADEGALKLKEISYIHAEGYAAGEMKHGSIALIEPDFLSVVCCPRDSVYEKTLSNVREIRSRGGPVIAMTSEGNEEIREHADETFEVPVTIEPLQPLLMAVPLQLLAYEVAIARRYDPDRPRNLAKSVTVE
jgi:glucosamine--fructose-6-phosphate aminotransferase (isomerizing)